MECNTFWQFIDEARRDVDDIFEIALALSERLLTLEPDENECEDILYVAQDAYESRTGEEFPYDAINTHQPFEPAGAPWDEEQLEALYPELCGKFF